MYHDLGESLRDSYTLPWPAFLGQLERLRCEGFVAEGFGGLEARLNGEDWPERYAVVTFDDGYRAFLRAAECLAERRMRATFFLTRDYCRHREGFLREPEIRELAGLAELGTHGLRHEPVTRLSLARARAALADSKHWLEDLTGREVRYMSVPGGYWNRACQRLAREVGYTLVGNSVQWWNRPETVARSGQVRRVALRTQFGPEVFERILRRDLRFFAGRRLRSWLLALPNALRGRWEIRRRQTG
jgi:peptidoglycan/xylan/chitin deacetylase (PgdA/CDA1 family)